MKTYALRHWLGRSWSKGSFNGLDEIRFCAGLFLKPIETTENEEASRNDEQEITTPSVGLVASTDGKFMQRLFNEMPEEADFEQFTNSLNDELNEYNSILFENNQALLKTNHRNLSGKKMQENSLSCKN